MMEVVEVPVAELNPAPYNPRKMSDDETAQLRASLERFGFVDPIVVNSNPARRNTVIGGHQRLRVAIAMGLEVVPVIYRDLSEEQERELNLRLNRNVGDWDWAELAAFDRAMLIDVGFSTSELAAHFILPPEQGTEINEGLADGIVLCTCPCGHQHHRLIKTS